MKVFVSPSAAARLAAADDWLYERRGGPLVVVGATLAAAGEALRRLTARAGAGFGWHRATLGRLAATLAAPSLAARRLAPAGALSVQALCARILHEGHARGTRLAPLADRPGTALALSRTLTELRLAGASAESDLEPLLAAYEAALGAAGLADRADVLRAAAETADHPLIGLPVLFLDVRVAHARERELVAALAARAPALATEPAADPLALAAELSIFSAADAAREAEEIARRMLREAAAGVPFERMAVLMRAPRAHLAPLAEALGRADIPASFAAGRPVPDPTGRAFLSLLACAEERLSARRFAEYLSLGEMASPSAGGAPPPARAPGERWAPAEDELLATGEAEAPVDAAGRAAPARWEALLIEAGVLEGRDRWRRRLAGMEARLSLDLRAGAEDRGDRARRQIEELRALAAFALPLVDELAALPARAPWGEWTARLGALATRALRRPDRVLALLAELEPMAPVGPVALAEVRGVLAGRLTDMMLPAESSPGGRVWVAPVDAVRGLAFDVVFVPGLSEGLFPHKIAEDPLLPDARRPAGLARRADRAADERALLLLAAGAARGRLYASYARLEDGRPRVPSIYLQELVGASEGRLPALGDLQRRAERDGASPGEPVDAAEYDVRAIAGATGAGAVRYLVLANDHLARAMRSRALRWAKKWTKADGLVRPSPEGRAALARHALTARSFSPTALQHFAACPYRFFLQAIHRLAPREEPERLEELDPLTRGSLVHDVLEAFLGELREAGLLPVDDVAAARHRLDGALDEVAARYHEDLAPAVERVWVDGIAAVRADLHEWLARQATEREWIPWRFELAFGIDARDPDSRAEPAPLDSGIRLRGSIDLVERNAAGALRATDFKTGKVRAQWGAIIGGGEILQPVLYALALEKIYAGTRVDSGRLYHITRAAGFDTVTVPLDAAARQAAATLAGAVGDALERGFLPAAPREGACRFCDYVPVCGPLEEERVRQKPAAGLERLVQLRRTP